MPTQQGVIAPNMIRLELTLEMHVTQYSGAIVNQKHERHLCVLARARVWVCACLCDAGVCTCNYQSIVLVTEECAQKDE